MAHFDRNGGSLSPESPVFTQQYRVGENKLLITRDKEEITSDTLQSPHDIDSYYRNKDGNKVRGYSINLAESCDKEELHLISHVDVRPVSVADKHFLQETPFQSKWNIEMLQSKKEKSFLSYIY